jgi:hypothetical protein
MVDWQITATTIYCDAVNDEVTLIISPEGLVKCTGQQKYEKPGKETLKAMQQKSRAAGKKLACEGIGCARVTKHKQEMLGNQ